MNKKTSKQEQPFEKFNLKTEGASKPGMEKGSSAAPEDIFAIGFLEKQHVQLQELFAQMKEETTEGGRRELLEKITTFLRNHSAIEERHFYPGVLNKDTEKLLSHSREEHKEAEEQLGKLYQAESFDDDFMDDFDKLVKDVQHHVQEEERKLFPVVAREIPMSTLTKIGEEMEKSFRMMKQSGPSVGDKVRTVARNVAEQED